MEKFDLYVDLSNNKNILLKSLAVDKVLALLGFSQFDIPKLRVDMEDKKEPGIPMLQVTPTNQGD